AEQHFQHAILLEPWYLLYRMAYAEFLWHDCHRYQDCLNQYQLILSHEKPSTININTNVGSNNNLGMADSSKCFFDSRNVVDVRFNYALLLRDHFHRLQDAVQQLQLLLQLNPNDSDVQSELETTKALLQASSTANELTTPSNSTDVDGKTKHPKSTRNSSFRLLSTNVRKSPCTCERVSNKKIKHNILYVTDPITKSHLSLCRMNITIHPNSPNLKSNKPNISTPNYDKISISKKTIKCIAHLYLTTKPSAFPKEHSKSIEKLCQSGNKLIIKKADDVVQLLHLFKSIHDDLPTMLIYHIFIPLSKYPRFAYMCLFIYYSLCFDLPNFSK
ncbi:hypothetical protein RFI_12909, partial [Reticulomyxa filosa]